MQWEMIGMLSFVFFCHLILHVYKTVVLQLYILYACPFRRLQPLSLVAEPFKIISAMAI